MRKLELFLLNWPNSERYALANIYRTFIELSDVLNKWKKNDLKIVFTNGCFDILHRGHVEYLANAKSFGDKLIVGLNSDLSVKKLKGEYRPFVSENDRAYLLSNLKMVDAIILFNEDTPFNLISQIIPDVLVKGGDYKVEDIVGRDIVEKNDGKVVTVNFVNGISTSLLIEKIKHTG